MAKPIKARQINETTYQYCYKYEDLKRWYERGKSHGDSGPILVKSVGVFDTYLCFGTIESPSKDITILSLVVSPVFDNVSPIPGVRAKERTMHSTIEKTVKTSAKMVFLNFGQP